jgi:hypothetical protein
MKISITKAYLKVKLGFKFYSTCVLIISSSITVYSQNHKPDSNLHLYLLIGQSNMAGRGVLDSQSKEIDPQILMLTRDTVWVSAVDPLHFDKKEAGVGPGRSFAKAMLSKSNCSTMKIGLIPAAVGGTSISLWKTGAYDAVTKSHPYDDALLRTKAAMKTGVLKGIIWHQGESDSSPQKSATYLDSLVTLVTKLRTELEIPNLPFVAGELGYFTEDKKRFNTMLHRLTERVPVTAIVSADQLVANPDKIHFDTASERILGKRYAEALTELSKGIK